MNDFDIIAIGDLATDAFIRLKDASIHCAVHKENCEICMRFGDKIPYESVTVIPAAGNSINVSVATAKLGLKSAVITNVGEDQYGHGALITLQKEGVSTRWVKINEGAKTNYHYVLWYEEDRTILIKHEKFNYELPDFGQPAWIYLSSLGEESQSMHQALGEYLENHPEVKLAFQPGTFQIKLGARNLRQIYQRTEIFFSNLQEAQKILETKSEDIKELLQGIAALGPKIVVITNGDNGAHAFDGETIWYQTIYPNTVPPLERTGAGDAFASTFLNSIHRGKSIPEALASSAVNSMSVTQSIGPQAGLLSPEEIEKYLSQAPESFQTKVIN